MNTEDTQREMQAIAAYLGQSVADVFGDPPVFSSPRMPHELEGERLSPAAIAEIAEFIRYINRSHICP